MCGRTLLIVIAVFFSLIVVPRTGFAAASPSITMQPQSQTAVAGVNVGFSVTATGQSLSYQWSFNGTNLTESAHILQPTSAMMIIVGVTSNDAGTYQCTVTNGHGSAISSNATLAVVFPAAIATPPTNLLLSVSRTAVFSVTASGTGTLVYQWQQGGTNLVDGGRVSGATGSTLTVSNVQMRDAGSYGVVVSNLYRTASAEANFVVVPVVAWGETNYGEWNIPASFTNVMTISSEGYQVEFLDLGLNSDGTVAAYGYNYYNGFGDAYFGQTNLSPLTNIVQVSAGFRHGMALKSDSTVVCFGANDFGEATPPAGLSNVVSVSGGGLYSLALKGDGTVIGWGTQGAPNPPAGLSNVVAINAGVFHALAVKSDGTVVGWGLNIYGEATSPVGLSNVVAVSAGSHHSLVLKSDGTVVAWGYNYYGQSTVPVGLSNVVAIAAGYYQSLALKSDGTIVAWGDNEQGQSSPPVGLTNVVGIDAGEYYSLALVQNPLAQVAPAITWQGPTNRTVPTGQTTVFIPYVTGSLPMKYQWFFNSTPLDGETNSWLMLDSIQPEQAGNYYFTVTNDYGAVTGRVATVQESPGIVTQPTNQSLLLGNDLNFSATAVGVGPLGYRWFFNGTPMTDGGRVSGATTMNLTVAAIQTNDAGSYQLVVTNDFGSAATVAATLTVLVPANITMQPVSQSALLSGNVTFLSSVTGTAPLNYQWYFNGTALTNGGRVSGAMATNLTIANAQTNDAGSYQLIVTNNYGTATSVVATLVVHVPPIITGQPLSPSVLLSGNATFSVVVSGDEPLSFQWYFNNAPLMDGGRVSGSATTNLSISNVQTNDAGSYQLVVTNDFGTTTSAVASLTVLVPPAITGQPVSLTALAGTNVTFGVTTIGTAPLSYFWFSNGVALVSGARIKGTTSATLSISGVQTNDSASYQLIVINNYGSTTSLVATLTVPSPAQITANPVSRAVLLGSNVTFSVTATGSALSYQWYFNGTPLSDGGRISGSEAAVLSVANIQSGDAGGYTVVVSNYFSTATSRTASLTALAALSASVRYVDLNSTNPLSPYLDWSTAATNIQDAIDAAVDGDMVLVTNGVYQSGGRIVYASATNRVAVTKAIAVQSVNGPQTTLIVGAANTSIPPDGIRCVYLTNGAMLSGFTLTNGSSRHTGDSVREESGGGVWCEDGSSIISNCVIVKNFATTYGGGAFRGMLINTALLTNSGAWGAGAASNVLAGCTLAGNLAIYNNFNRGGGAYCCTLSNCILSGNICNSLGMGGGAYASVLTACTISNNFSASYGGGLCLGSAIGCLISSNRANSNGGGSCSNTLNNCLLQKNFGYVGGGAYSNVLNNCIVRNNSAVSYGGGASGAVLLNCTIVSNTASLTGGGVDSGTLNNCIIYHNNAPKIPDYPNDNRSVLNYCDAVSALATNGVGNITNEPAFVDLANGDFHLQPNSPCINSGNNSYVKSATDFDGNPRIAGGTVVIGAFEFQSPASIISYAYLQRYNLPTDGSVDSLDSDGDGMNTWQEWLAGTDPTNAVSALAMFTPSNNVSGVTVRWQSLSGKTYFLQRAIDLAAQPVFSVLQSNIFGESGTTTYTDRTATNGGPYFYRVGVQ